jgi:hypothetical protein
LVGYAFFLLLVLVNVKPHFFGIRTDYYLGSECGSAFRWITSSS